MLCVNNSLAKKIDFLRFYDNGYIKYNKCNEIKKYRIL